MLSLGSILVPLDGSALADEVLPHVERLGIRNEGVVHLLRVTGGPDARREQVAREAEEAAAHEHLRRTRARLEELELRVEVHTAHGEPADEILAAAARLKVGLIAMTSHGRSGILRWLRGSVAEAVLRDSAAPVLLISAAAADRPAPARFRRILVCLDGSERSASIVPYVIVLARESEAEVLLARAAGPDYRRPVLAQVFEPARVLESLRPWRERFEAAGVKVRAFVLEGDPACELIDAAERERVDLVALATHGRKGIGRFIDGSIAEKVLRHCRRPLLVVRAPTVGGAA